MPYTQDGLPFARGSRTSKAAADSMAPDAGRLRDRVFSLIRKAGEQGATDDEIERWLSLTHQCASARRNELMKSAVIMDSGKTRLTRSKRAATVWIEAPEGHAYKPPSKPPTPKECRLVLHDLRAIAKHAEQQGYTFQHLEALTKLGDWLKHRAGETKG